MYSWEKRLRFERKGFTFQTEVCHSSLSHAVPTIMGSILRIHNHFDDIYGKPPLERSDPMVALYPAGLSILIFYPHLWNGDLYLNIELCILNDAWPSQWCAFVQTLFSVHSSLHLHKYVWDVACQNFV